MLYAFKLCVLTFVVFLAVLTGLVLAILAWPNGEWGFLNTLMASQSVVMFAAAWYLSGCYRFIKKPEPKLPLSVFDRELDAEEDLQEKIKRWQREAETNPLLFRSNNAVDRNGPDADTEEQPSDGIGGHQYGDLD